MRQYNIAGGPGAESRKSLAKKSIDRTIHYRRAEALSKRALDARPAHTALEIFEYGPQSKHARKWKFAGNEQTRLRIAHVG